MSRNFKLSLVTLAFVFLCFGAVQADTVTITGDTFLPPPSGTRDGFFNRPKGENEMGTGLSTIATNIAFDSTQFRVSQTGSYTFLLTSLEPDIYDPFLVLYQNNFNSAAPLTNFVIANDDLALGNFVQSGFTVNLTANLNYFSVVTGFDDDGDERDEGFFSLVISGPGTITVGGGAPAAIPEPATMILLGTGLAGVVARVRRRRAVGGE